MSWYVAGLDAGQSSTTAVIGDEHGRILGRGCAGPADEVAVRADSMRLHDALRDALDAARIAADLAPETTYAAIVAGVSGYEGRIHGRTPELPSKELRIMHDAPVAHTGALAGLPGIIAIAGTGSVVYSVDASGATLTLGGWGYLFGDEGSAFWIARDALALLMRAQDERNHSFSNETRAACEFFGMPSLRRIARAYYTGSLTRDRLAAFACVASEFEVFGELIDRGAQRLAQLVGEAIVAGATPRVALVGGVARNGYFTERFAAWIHARAPDAEIVEPIYEPAIGALWLAYRELGRVPETLAR